MPNWTDEQKSIIQSPPNARILVNAGPGTGKTAVACARITYLVDKLKIEPENIWLVSFTRTAVHELRSRISEYLNDKQQAKGIRIATIDSYAWAIHSGFSQNAAMTGSYEENIQKVIELIKSKEGVFEYLSDVRHLFVDEAQDVVGVRCELILEIIYALSSDTGVTVLSDEAQSIYGFTEDDTDDGIKETLPRAIRKYFNNFEEKKLVKIHRTDDPILCRIFSEGRQIVSGDENGYQILAKIREFIKDENHGDLGQFRDDIKNIEDMAQSTFMLFRRRGEALEASISRNHTAPPQNVRATNHY